MTTFRTLQNLPSGGRVSVLSAEPKIKYLDCEPVLIDKPLPWQLAGLSYTATGYGSKIPSSKCVRVNGRLRRVYVTQYGNAGSAWIILNGERVHLRG